MINWEGKSLRNSPSPVKNAIFNHFYGQIHAIYEYFKPRNMFTYMQISLPVNLRNLTEVVAKKEPSENHFSFKSNFAWEKVPPYVGPELEVQFRYHSRKLVNLFLYINDQVEQV